MTHELRRCSLASTFIAVRIFLCPKCTPSKLPIVAEVEFSIGSSGSNITFISVVNELIPDFVLELFVAFSNAQNITITSLLLKICKL